MKHPSLGNQRGSITVFTISAVVIGVIFLLMVANIGNIWLKKDLAQDSAEMLAPLILANQLSYRKTVPQNPDSAALVQTLAADATLAQSFGTPFSITYQFGTANDTGTTFTPLNISDPDPSNSSEYFNAVAVQVNTTPKDLGGFFNRLGLSVPALIAKGQAIATVDATASSCFCNAYCSTKSLPFLCYPICIMFSMFQMMINLFTLDGQGFLDALACLLQSVHLMAVSAWDWAWGTASVIINL